MKFVIRHEIPGRIRAHFVDACMSMEQADILELFVKAQPGVRLVKVYERNADIAIVYEGDRGEMIRMLQAFHYEDARVSETQLANSSRALNRQYYDALVMSVVKYAAKRILLPTPISSVLCTIRAVPYIIRGIRSLAARRLDVAVLDAAAIGVSLLRKDFTTAGSTMFLLGIGGILEEWTHKKSVDDLAHSLSLNVDKVWLQTEDSEVLVPSEQIQKGDVIHVRMGTVIPFDGDVADGEAMVNQASLTGESVPAAKAAGGYAYAGTVVEEGELYIRVRETDGRSKFEKIVDMIEDSEKLKSAVESKAEHMADRLVPYTLAGTALTYLITRNVTKAMAVLMVDFSCALKLSMPITMLSAIREASTYGITVKGGKFLEAVAEADTIVFDKTGTLTKAEPTVASVVPFNDMDENELLRIAACLEEHFPHSMAKAVVDAAKARDLSHEELHSKVDYVVAHGISSWVGEHQVLLGSYHFIFEDEKCRFEPEKEARFAALPAQYSHLYMAIDGVLAAVICIEDPLQPEAVRIVSLLKELGISHTIMMTGDSERTAAAIAAAVGVDEYYSEVLPEDKAQLITRRREEGHRVIMVGDGINDSPALSAADVGIAISEGAQIARQIADVTIQADNLYGLLMLKRISDAVFVRIRRNYRTIIGFNGALIALGIGGLIAPGTSSLLHNLSTIAISVHSMADLIEKEDAVE